MKVLVITVAGTATRFNKDTASPTLKCIYHEGDVKKTLLYKLLNDSKYCDKFIIVGGYLYELLENFIKDNLSEFSEKIELVYNSNYIDLGSMKSLYDGLLCAEKYNPDEIIFAEGDLFLSSKDFDSVVTSKCDVITINKHPITADKAVALYFNVGERVRYIYDTKHKSFKIQEDFLSIYNSGQVWKFIDMNLLFKTLRGITLKDNAGTNLVLIERYFSEKKLKDIEIVNFEMWHNCNTVIDYKNAFLQRGERK